MATETNTNGKTKPSGTSAYELILAAIENGDLKPGSRLRETELAARLGLSRTPVREAFKQLEAEGVIEHLPHQGAVVSQLDYGAIVELYFLREVLEGAAARLAAIHATDTEIEVIKAMVEADRNMLDKPEELTHRNKLFHQQVYRASRNRFLIRALDNMRTTLVLGTTLETGARSSTRTAIDGHAELIEAIEKRDPDAAEAAARNHVRGAFKVRLARHAR